MVKLVPELCKIVLQKIILIHPKTQRKSTGAQDVEKFYHMLQFWITHGSGEFFIC